jgi:flagellin-like hook-associated protein FlgL
MGLRIKTNVASLRDKKQRSAPSKKLQLSTEKLASGGRVYRLSNTSSETYENRTTFIRSAQDNQQNIENGTPLATVTKESSAEISNILIRLRELSTQQVAYKSSSQEQSFIGKEYNDLVQEIDRIANVTDEIDVPLLTLSAQGFVESEQRVVSLQTKDSLDDMRYLQRKAAVEKLPAIDQALRKVSSNPHADLESKQSSLSSAINLLSIAHESLSASQAYILPTPTTTFASMRNVLTFTLRLQPFSCK